jgi:glycosyltransferase involved in cell wall biosynthesis
MLISIIVPCYNEEAMIPMFYNELCSIVDSLSNYSFEIIFVDDGSHDTSLEKMRTLSVTATP